MILELEIFKSHFKNKRTAAVNEFTLSFQISIL